MKKSISILLSLCYIFSLFVFTIAKAEGPNDEVIIQAKTILVTGGAGYIGSHTCVELLQQGYNIIVIDNYSKADSEALRRVEAITGKSLTAYQVDIKDTNGLRYVFSRHNIYAVIHFAGLKAVGESTRIPLHYYENNVYGTANLCKIMNEFNVKKIIISSSQTVYGCVLEPPFSEDMEVSHIINPYGRTKRIIEEMMMDLHKSDPEWSISLLRYVNPLGAHESGLLGEVPTGTPKNLLPSIAKVAKGELPVLRIFGGDYDTPDGTCLRDYIHVVDLAKGHISCLEKISTQPGVHIYNMATGKAFSVLEVIHAFERACGRKIPFEIVERRTEDLPISFATTDKAEREFGFRVDADLDKMCRDYWNFHVKNPDGYRDHI